MNINCQQTCSTVVPFSAIVLHQQRGTDKVYATKHKIFTTDGQQHLISGSLLSQDDLALLVKALQGSEDSVRWVDSEVLATGHQHMLWYSAPRLRPMFFNSSNVASCGMKVNGNGMLPCPGLVWLLVGGDLYVFATKAKGRPGRDECLYQAPFWNVWSNGRVCIGSARKPEGLQEGDPQAWEQMFFGSEFTHPNFKEDKRLLKDDPVKFWADQLQQPSKVFPVQKMVPIGLTVGDIATSQWRDAVRRIPKAQGEF